MATTTQLILETIVRGAEQAASQITDIGKSLKNAEGASQSFAKGLGIAAAAIGAAGIAAGAMAIKIAGDFAKVGDEMAKMSKRTGISTEALSKLRYVGELANVDMGTMEVTLKRLSVQLTNAQGGSKSAIASFDRLGLSVKDFAGLQPDQVFMKTVEALKGIEDPMQRAAVATDLFGRAGTQLLPLLSEDMAKISAEAEKFGLVVSAKAAAASEEYNDSITRLHGAFAGLKASIAADLLPILTPLIQGLTDLVVKTREWYTEIGGLQGILTGIKSFLTEHWVALTLIAGAITGALIPAFVAFATTLLTVTIPAIAAAALALAPFIIGGTLIAGLIAGIYYLATNWDIVAAKIKSLWEGLKTYFSTTVAAWKIMFTDLWNGLVAIVNGAKGAVIAAFTAVFEGAKQAVGAAIDWMIQKIKDLLQFIKDIPKMAVEAATSIGGKIGGAVAGLFGGARAEGGPVQSGKSYVVGERGPEWFTPGMNGAITPMGRPAGVTININTMIGEREFAEKMGDMIVRQLGFNVAY